MSYEDRDTYGMYKSYDEKGPGPRLMGADTLMGEDVYNQRGEDLGDIKEIMLDMNNGKIAYAVLSFGGFLGMGDKLFAVPWNALTLDTENKRFILQAGRAWLRLAAIVSARSFLPERGAVGPEYHDPMFLKPGRRHPSRLAEVLRSAWHFTRLPL